MQHTPYFKHNQNKIQKQNKQANIKDASINLVVILTFFSNNCDFGHNNEKNPANIWKINEKGWGGKTMIKCFFFFTESDKIKHFLQPKNWNHFQNRR